MDSVEDSEKRRAEEDSPEEVPLNIKRKEESENLLLDSMDVVMEDEIGGTDAKAELLEEIKSEEAVENNCGEKSEDSEMQEDVVETNLNFETVVNKDNVDDVTEEKPLVEEKVEETKTEEEGGEIAGDELVELEEPPSSVPYFWEYNFEGELNPVALAEAVEEFSKCEFLKGCKWAPDGSCLLTNSDDSRLRIFNFPGNVSHVQDWNDVKSGSIEVDRTWRSALSVKEGGLVYDYNWYPFASSMDPATTVFLTTSKDAPIHLWDATYGNLRATYLAYNDVDEPTAAYSVAFDSSGENIFAGYEKMIRIFNIARPGRQCVVRKLTTSLLPDLNQHGLISCFAFNPAWSNVYACGSYRKTIGLYMEDGTVISVLEGHTGGVTHLAFSRDGTKLYSGARSDSSLLCWDLRNMANEYKVYKRVVETQQRIYFELTMNDRYLISGGTDGVVRLWDTLEENPEPKLIQSGSDCINGVSINPYVPVLATASGKRKLDTVIDDSDDETFLAAVPKHEKVCDVKLWKL